MYWIWLLTYRDGLKGGPQVLWNEMKKLRSPACSRQENAIFHFMVTKPGVHLLGHPRSVDKGRISLPKSCWPRKPWMRKRTITILNIFGCMPMLLLQIVHCIQLTDFQSSYQCYCHQECARIYSMSFNFCYLNLPNVLIHHWMICIATVMSTISIEMPWI